MVQGSVRVCEFVSYVFYEAQPMDGVGPRQGAMSLVFRIRAKQQLLTRCPALVDFADVDGSVVLVLKVPLCCQCRVFCVWLP